MLAKLAYYREHSAQRHAVLEGAFTGTLDYRAVGHRIGKRHAKFDQIGAVIDECLQDTDGRVPFGIAGRNVGDEGTMPLFREFCEASFDSVRDLHDKKTKA
jgi:hypothetical protein